MDCMPSIVNTNQEIFAIYFFASYFHCISSICIHSLVLLLHAHNSAAVAI